MLTDASMAQAIYALLCRPFIVFRGVGSTPPQAECFSFRVISPLFFLNPKHPFQEPVFFKTKAPFPRTRSGNTANRNRFQVRI